MLTLQRCEGCAKNLALILRHNFHTSPKYRSKPKVQFKSIENKNLRNLVEKHQDKIIYNTYLHKLYPYSSFIKQVRLREKEKLEQRRLQTVEPLPASLKYIMMSSEEPPEESKVEEGDRPTHFPYKTDTFEISSNESVSEKSKEHKADKIAEEVAKRHSVYTEDDFSKWMADYENFEDDELLESTDQWKINYGTPDPHSEISNVPCGGCGALLHCKDTAIPGYIPSEIYYNSFRREGANLKALTCQRCHFLKNYNLALQVRVSPQDYPKVLSTIKRKKALVVLLVDLLDFPCSVWPGILDILGPRQPFIVVGNKADLLPRDSRGYLHRIRETLKENMENTFGSTKIKDVALISAKTGWGVEDLITKLHNAWGSRGDVYLVGCTNVGKSSLFNCLLQSDYCKVQAADLVQRATTSVWPGTTLNMLKFPILRPSGWRLYVRAKRLHSVRRLIGQEDKLKKLQLSQTQDPKYATLVGHLDRTFSGEKTPEEAPADPFAVQGRSNSLGQVQLGIDEKNPIYVASKWCYDTPGVVQTDQIINMLTTEELTLALPRELIRPQTFGIRVGQTLFIAGLARLDYLEGPRSIRLTVFCSSNLPITICDTENAEMLYEHLLGTEVLKVPKGPPERMKTWPGLKAGKLMNLTSEEKYKSCGDIVLSSAGWVAVTVAEGNSEVSFKAWTPEARGIFLRKSLLPFADRLRGEKLRKSPMYESKKFYIPA